MQDRKTCDVSLCRQADANGKPRWKRSSTWLLLAGIVMLFVLFFLAAGAAISGSVGGDFIDVGDWLLLLGYLTDNALLVIIAIIFISVGVVASILGH